MASDLRIGAVLDWDDFVFPDGSSKDKLLLVLGAKQGHNYLLVLATSKPHQRHFEPGCNAGDGYYFIPGGGKDFFNKDTWIILSEPQIANAAEMLSAFMGRRVRVIDNLRDQLTNAIRNCLKLVDDVSQVHKDLL